MSRNSSSPTSPSRSRAGTVTCTLGLSGPGDLPACGTPRRGCRAVGVGFEEPEPLVHAARDLVADVGRFLVPQLFRLADCPPDALAEARQRVGQGPHVLLPARDIDR